MWIECRMRWSSANGSSGMRPEGVRDGGNMGPRKFRLPLLKRATPPPSSPMKPILSHVPSRKGLNSMALTRAMAGEKASRADRRFIETPRICANPGIVLKPRCQLFQRHFTNHLVPQLLVADAAARGFIQLRQQVKSYVGRLKVFGFSMADVVHQRAERGVTRRRDRSAALRDLRNIHSRQHA